MDPQPNQDQLSKGNQPNLVAMEHEIIELWKREQFFEKLMQLRLGKPLFRFLDGPITANNPMGVHHAWGRSLKDIFIRYKALRGFDSQFQNGFDCQGLWVEVEVEKDLGFKGKPDIEAFGLDKFSEACKARIDKFSKIQTEQSIRLGQWMDWSDSYYTHTDKNIQGIWEFLSVCQKNGWLYKSGLPMPWCTRCGTSLSEHEMAGSYKTLSHLAVYIKLRIPKLNSKILVWTTTPWTLPANTSLAVNEKLTYAQVEIEGEDTPLIISTDVLQRWSEGTLKKKKHRVLKTMKGSELEGLEYEPIFADLPVQAGFEHKIVLWDQVDPTEGTGVVHIAPGCGREDYELSKQVTLKRLTPVDEKGDYIQGYGFLEGKNAKQVADDVATYLQQHGKLYSKYQHEHSYPVCWRCKDELIFRLVDEWYISSNEIRPRLIAASGKVKWQPEHVGKRMENWLQNMGDWCISRKRFWGLPLPFYQCGSCKTLTVVGSKEELTKLSPDDLSKVPELHRPWIDTIRIKCPSCSNLVNRVTEVGDCWLDAGIVPYSTKGCYAKNSDGSMNDNWQPADWICEMSEQVRLWFYSMLYMGVALDNEAPYKHVLTYERVLAEDGAKFSKTGYMIKFDEAAERMGVDTMRYYFASQPPTGDIRFGYQQGDETRRQLISLWNMYSFFNTYAQIDKPDLDGFKNAEKHLLPIDKWLLASLHDFVSNAVKGYEDYNTPLVIREFENFAEGLSNWYIRSNRRRFWKSGDSTEKTAGYWTLFQAIKAACVVMSPICPFLTEKIWQDCVRVFQKNASESIHFTDWPEVPSTWADEANVKRVSRVRQVINLAHRLRAESKVKVRQPLATLYVAGPDAAREACQAHEATILGELNVKALTFVEDKSTLAESYLELDLKLAGPALKGDVGKVTQLVNGLQGEVLKETLKQVRGQDAVTIPGHNGEIPSNIFIVKARTKPEHVAVEEQDLVLALDLRVTKELEQEGWVRDILRQIQVLRKDSGLDVQDRIQLSLVSSEPEIQEAIKVHHQLIEDETLGVLDYKPMDAALGSFQVNLKRGEKSVGQVQVSIRKR